MDTIPVGNMVEKLGSSKDGCTGRHGLVIEVNGERARVKWTLNPDLSEMKPIRTWVNFKFLRDLGAADPGE